MSILSKKRLAGTAAALIAGLSLAALANPAAADVNSYHHHWLQPEASPYTFAYDADLTQSTDYHFTNSNFCMPDAGNAYNGSFATLAYDTNSRAVGYVCR